MSLQTMYDEEILIEDPQYEERKGGNTVAIWVNPGTYRAACDPASASPMLETMEEGNLVEWDVMTQLLNDSGIERSPLRLDARVRLPSGVYGKILTAQRFEGVRGSAIPTYWYLRVQEAVQTG